MALGSIADLGPQHSIIKPSTTDWFTVRATDVCTLHAADAAVDSWDKLRELAVNVLGLLPCPLPGLETPALLHQRVCPCSCLASQLGAAFLLCLLGSGHCHEVQCQAAVPAVGRSRIIRGPFGAREEACL